MKKITILAFCLFSGIALAIDKTPRSVEEYSKLFKKIQTEKNLSIEKTYEKGLIAVLDLSDSLSFNEDEINSKWLKSIREKMVGFELNPNTETFVATPKLDFFLALAKKRNIPEDVAFFELALKTKPDGNWPAYIQQETDISGCTVYDGTLSKLHQDWSNFQKKYPKSFAKISRDYLEDIEVHLSQSHCSCSRTADPIIKELQNFIKTNPKLPITLKIQKRVEAINAKKPPSSGCEN